jgi:hypothetical protein
MLRLTVGVVEFHDSRDAIVFVHNNLVAFGNEVEATPFAFSMLLNAVLHPCLLRDMTREKLG